MAIYCPLPQKRKRKSAGKDMENLELFSTAGGNVTWYHLAMP